MENNMKKFLLGIDVGTTGTKTILFSQSGEPLRHAYRAYPTAHPNIGESEQTPFTGGRLLSILYGKLPRTAAVR